jgi:iron complex outermembrane receptor protein
MRRISGFECYCWRWRQLGIVFLAMCPMVAHGQTEEPPSRAAADLTQVSIENLMNMEVTSASKREQKLSRVAAAIFVITKEDIRRSGATNIPDLLRMVPGMNVAQINGNSWAISARGLNEEFSDKLLVMIDGRSVYTPTFGGVYWDTLDLPLEDIERIEVVRGPGGTVWGANAVNGVVNIITKTAAETQGFLVVTGGGTVHQGFGTAQYGGKFGHKTDYRAYAKYHNESHMPGLDGRAAADDWNLWRSGFRVDSRLAATDQSSFQGDLYGGHKRESVGDFSPAGAIEDNSHLSGGYLQGIWSHAYSDDSESSLRISYDRYERSTPFRDNRNTLDAEFQHQFSWGSRNELVWAVDYRRTNHDGDSTRAVYDEVNDTRQLFSGFVQDEWEIVRRKLFVTAGAKLEHTDYNGFELLPSTRVAWQPEQKQMLWAAWSRSTRTPSSGDAALHLDGVSPGPGGLPVQTNLTGSPDFKNEILLAYEAGYRAAVEDFLSVDVSAYYHTYDDLRTIETGTPMLEFSPPSPHVLVPAAFRNLMSGEGHGLEVAGNWRPAARWALKTGYAFERLHMHRKQGSDDMFEFASAEGGSPHHSAQLQSHVELGHGLTWDASAYFAGRLSAFQVPAYTRVDTGLTWQVAEKAWVSIVGQNLVKDHQLEFSNLQGLTQSSLTKRSVYGKLTWEF